MTRARAIAWLLAIAGCAASSHIDPARFTPNPAWSYAIAPEPPPPVARPSRDQMIEDVAYLLHAIDTAWAWPSRATIDTFQAIPGYLRDIPLHAHDAATECAQLAEQLRTTGIRLSLGGTSCSTPTRATPAGDLGTLDPVPADRNFHLRIERAADHAVGILTISRFADLTDPGWQGFAETMRELATLELVIVDVQHAGGEDPRAGFAVLAALGLEHLQSAYLRPAEVRDNDLAKVARANAQRLFPATPPPRDRVLWSSFPTDADVKRIAREVAPEGSRSTRPVAVQFLFGAGCASGCQLMLQLARWQGVELFGTTEERLSGDELGAIRLPHSGIIATFPTASYGPYLIGPLSAAYQSGPADLATTLLARLHKLGHERAEAIAWRTRPLPDCRELPIDRKLLDAKTNGCRPAAPQAVETISLFFAIEGETAQRFLATCPGITVGSTLNVGANGSSIATIGGSADALSRVFGAPFVLHGEWPCKYELTTNTTQ
jgi:hypothetical protein